MTIEIGKYNQLTVLRQTRAGVILTDGQQEVLLPHRWASEELNRDDELEVFVLTDAEGTPIATTQRPFACVGEMKYLTVTDDSSHGTFVDWGLEKELLVPFAEQEAPMDLGSSHVIAVRLDNRGERIIGSARLSRILRTDVSGINVGRRVELLVQRFTDLGAQVIVDHAYCGLVHNSDIFEELSIGQELVGFVSRVTPEAHLDITLKAPGKAGHDQDAQTILNALDAAGGQLPLHDRSPPEEITRTLNMSKKAFKRAVGNLYRERTIELTGAGIKRTEVR